MDDQLPLIGLDLPHTWVMLRLKIVFGGVCGLGASCCPWGSDWTALARGDMMAACGIAQIGIVSRLMTREARRAAADRERPTWAARWRVRPATAQHGPVEMPRPGR